MNFYCVNDNAIKGLPSFNYRCFAKVSLISSNGFEVVGDFTQGRSIDFNTN